MAVPGRQTSGIPFISCGSTGQLLKSNCRMALTGHTNSILVRITQCGFLGLPYGSCKRLPLRRLWSQGLRSVTLKSGHLHSGNPGRSSAVILKMYNFTHVIAARNIIQGFPRAYEIKTTETASGLTGEVHLSDSLEVTAPT